MDATSSHPTVVVLSATTPDRELADRIASVLVQEQLAACAQVGGPIRSTYRWEGEVHADEEWTLTVKAAASRRDAAVARIVELHPYDVPEILVTPVVGGHQPYLDWVAASGAGSG